MKRPRRDENGRRCWAGSPGHRCGHGIGAAIVARLLRDSWRVAIADIRTMSASETRAGSRFVLADVGNEASVQELVAGIELREQRLDALICNAEIMIRKSLAELSLAEWNQVIATNLTSTFLLTRAAARMLAVAKGSVITITSTRAHMSEPNTKS